MNQQFYTAVLIALTAVLWLIESFYCATSPRIGILQKQLVALGRSLSCYCFHFLQKNTTIHFLQKYKIKIDKFHAYRLKLINNTVRNVVSMTAGCSVSEEIPSIVDIRPEWVTKKKVSIRYQIKTTRSLKSDINFNL